MNLLMEMERANRHRGADIREEAYRVATHPALHDALLQSDSSVASLPCHSRLRDYRRWGILRFPKSHAHAALPLDPPLPPILPSPDEWPNFTVHWGRYIDELEWVPFWAVPLSGGGWRPPFAIMNSFEIRGFFGLSAVTFYELNRSNLIPGRLYPSSRYDTMTVCRWFYRHLEANSRLR
jgi:hypothetical protein